MKLGLITIHAVPTPQSEIRLAKTNKNVFIFYNWLSAEPLYILWIWFLIYITVVSKCLIVFPEKAQVVFISKSNYTCDGN